MSPHENESQLPSNVISIANRRRKNSVLNASDHKDWGAPWVICDHSEFHSSFNTRENRSFREKFSVLHYRIWDRYGEAVFDRDQSVAARKENQPLNFMAGCVHSEKLLYLILCKEFEFDYQPFQPPLFEIWPKHIAIDLPSRVRENAGIVQRMFLPDLKRVSNKIYEVHTITTFNHSLTIRAQAKVRIL